MPYPPLTQPVKCVVWGIENEYENVLNQLKFEELKGNIKVLALVCRSEDRYSSYHDGYRVVTREDLEFIDFDVVIIANEHRYSELKRDCFNLKNRNTKWNGYAIKASVFKLPNFDFALYFNLIKNPVTIVSDDCWGAYVYHQLGLEFTSPFTLTFISGKEYVKVFNDPEYYLKQDLIFLREGDPLLGCPVGTIGQGEKKVKIEFRHCLSFDEAKQDWNRRRKRINFNNIFLKANCFFEDSLTANMYHNKNAKQIIFTDKKTYLANTDNLFILRKINRNKFIRFDKGARERYFSRYEINFIRLLCGMKNYSRES